MVQFVSPRRIESCGRGIRMGGGQSEKEASKGDVTVEPPGLPRQALKPDRQPGMIDVARLAGVSYQTVSRVVNDLPDVRASTRVKVLAAVEQLGYRRNLTARALKTRLPTTFGIVSDGSPRFGPLRTLLALESAAREAGYGSTVVTVKEPHAQSVPLAIRGLEESGVGGIIVITPRIGFATVVRETRVRVPVVMIAAGEAGRAGSSRTPRTKSVVRAWSHGTFLIWATPTLSIWLDRWTGSTVASAGGAGSRRCARRALSRAPALKGTGLQDGLTRSVSGSSPRGSREQFSLRATTWHSGSSGRSRRTV